jgi:hypothetical protein
MLSGITLTNGPEMFPQILVKSGIVEFYENTISVFGMICGEVEGQICKMYR